MPRQHFNEMLQMDILRERFVRCCLVSRDDFSEHKRKLNKAKFQLLMRFQGKLTDIYYLGVKVNRLHASFHSGTFLI